MRIGVRYEEAMPSTTHTYKAHHELARRALKLTPPTLKPSSKDRWMMRVKINESSWMENYPYPSLFLSLPPLHPLAPSAFFGLYLSSLTACYKRRVRKLPRTPSRRTSCRRSHPRSTKPAEATPDKTARKVMKINNTDRCERCMVVRRRLTI